MRTTSLSNQSTATPGTTRNNPPRRNIHPSLNSHKYWNFSNDEIGRFDIGCQVDHIHYIKQRELGLIPIHAIQDLKPFVSADASSSTASFQEPSS